MMMIISLCLDRVAFRHACPSKPSKASSHCKRSNFQPPIKTATKAVVNRRLLLPTLLSSLHLQGKKFIMKINNGSGFLLLLLQLKYASAFPILPTGRAAATTVALRSEPERTRDVSVGSGTIPSASIPGALSNGAVPEKPQNLFVAASPILVQGNSLRTWSFPNSNVKRVQLLIKTQGRPLHTNIEIWQ